MTNRPPDDYYRSGTRPSNADDDSINSRQSYSRLYGGDEPSTIRANSSQRMTRKRRKPSFIFPMLGAFAIFLLAAAASYAAYLYRTSQAVRRYGPAILQNANVGGEFPGVNAINLMIIGRDYDYNNRDQVIKTHARSDMLMVARIDFVAKTARILSIPRDTSAAIPGHGVTKINAAHAIGGPALTSQTIQQNFGITTDHYVAMDFQGFEEAIDKIGGVDCTVDRKMDYDDDWGHLHIHLMPGFQHLDGEQAMDFVRFRHADSDLIRTQRQQTLLASLKEKLVQPETFALLPVVLDTIDKHTDSDLTDGQKVALARFLHDLPKQNVQMATLPSNEGGELVQTDFTRAAPLVKAWFGVDLPSGTAPMPTGDIHARRHHRHRRRPRHSEITPPLNGAGLTEVRPTSSAAPSPADNIYD